MFLYQLRLRSFEINEVYCLLKNELDPFEAGVVLSTLYVYAHLEFEQESD